jgi:excisionase family DNA binding protein
MGKLLTVEETAERLSCSRSAVYQLCAARLLPHTRVGLGRGRIRISEADLEVYLASRHVEPERPALKFIR